MKNKNDDIPNYTFRSEEGTRSSFINITYLDLIKINTYLYHASITKAQISRSRSQNHNYELVVGSIV